MDFIRDITITQFNLSFNLFFSVSKLNATFSKDSRNLENETIKHLFSVLFFSFLSLFRFQELGDLPSISRHAQKF